MELRRLGFSMFEVMEGTHKFCGNNDEYNFRFDVEWGDAFEDFVCPDSSTFMSARVNGKITVGGLCDDAECYGRLHLDYLSTASITYILFFEANGKRYKYIGSKKDIRPWNLHRTHTTCYGEIIDITNVDKNEIISKSICYFRIHRLPSFLMSFRIKEYDYY